MESCKAVAQSSSLRSPWFVTEKSWQGSAALCKLKPQNWFICTSSPSLPLSSDFIQMRLFFQENKTPESTSHQTSVWVAEKAKEKEKKIHLNCEMFVYSCIKINLSPVWIYLSKGVLNFIYCKADKKPDKQRNIKRAQNPFHTAQIWKFYKSLVPKISAKLFQILTS